MRRLDVRDFERYQFPSGLAASPDGNMCAYVVAKANIAQNCYESDIWLYDRKSGENRRLTSGGRESAPVWLDQNTLLYATSEGRGAGESVFRAVCVDGGESWEYMRIPMEVTWLAPLNAGKFALLAKYHMHCAQDPSWTDGGLHGAEYIVADELPFRQDGLGITNGMRFRAYVYDPGVQSLTPISDETQFVEFIGAKDNRVVYSARHFEKHAPYQFKGNIAVYNADAGSLREYVDEDTYRVYFCGFAGDEIVFMGAKGLHYGYQENSSFYRIDEATGREVLFAENHESTGNAVCTDSRYGHCQTAAATSAGVYYSAAVHSDSVLKLAGMDGSIRVLAGGEGSVDCVSPLENGDAYYIAMEKNRLPEVYLLSGGVSQRITALNDGIYAQYTLSDPEKVTFESAGLSLEGFVIPPVGMKADQKYPGILYIHGGHKLTFGSVYYHEMQVWANRGFFVYFCNPRGSDGWGDEFADVIGKYGHYEFEDFMRFTDVCLEKYPQLDVERLGVGGGSYGGYMTNWIIGHTDRFRCAVSQRGIASLISMFGTSDTSYLFPVWQFDTDIWMDIERYWEHSPLKYANRCTTPTLFIHSENDFRCPTSEGIQMFQALQYNGIESRLCIFKGESHGLSRVGKPRNRAGRLAEITRWFEKYLKNAEQKRSVEA